MYSVTKEFHFEAAHSLPKLPVSHKCHHIHGHSYKVVVHYRSRELTEIGWVLDYGKIKECVQPIIDRLDHKNLNDILPFATTAENIARWILEQLSSVRSIRRVDVHETEGTSCSYESDVI